MHRRLIPVLLSATVSLAACGGSARTSEIPDSASTAASAGASGAAAGVRVVSPADAQALLADGSRVLIDVRTPEEYAEGHLAGAQLIDFNAPDFASKIKELDRGTRYVIYCRSGNRSGQARELMTSLGFGDVADIEGGILAWSDAGLPVEH